jgi:hypothetical protein
MYLPLLQVLRRGEELEHMYTVSNNVFYPSGAEKRGGS